MTPNWNQLAKEIHADNHHWWHDAAGNRIERNKGELLMLVVTELAEAVEGIRKNLMDDHLPNRKMEEVEMADAAIRLLDFAGGFQVDLTEKVIIPLHFWPEENKDEQILLIVRNISCCLSCHYDQEPMEYWVLSSLKRIVDYCDQHKLDLFGAMAEKRAYNKTRRDHTHEARAEKGGKSF